MSVDATRLLGLQPDTPTRFAEQSRDEPLVIRNDWRRLAVPAIGTWTPRLSVSVVVPAYREQHELDVTLAALAAQTYPAHLLEVVVADDGSTPPLRLPELRPERCRLIRVADGWGRAAACAAGARVADGDVIHWLDSDMAPFHDHVEAQLRWHHVVSYAVTLGYKRFVPDEALTPDRLDALIRAATQRRLPQEFGFDETEPHRWVEEVIESTQGLAESHRPFTVHVGATATVRRDLYEAAGGMDASLHLGEDIELGYRLEQQGAVFIPDPEARSWHLGSTQVMRRGQRVNDYNHPYFANRVPRLYSLRRGHSPIYEVPTVDVRLLVDDVSHGVARATVDSLIVHPKPDVHVALIGRWGGMHHGRRAVLDDDTFDLHWLAENYRVDPRVRFLDAPEPLTSAAPFVCEWPVECAASPDTMRRIVRRMEGDNLGLLEITVGDGSQTRKVRVWRAGAVARVLRVGRGGRPLAQQIDDCWGSGSATADEFAIVPHNDRTLRYGGVLRRHDERVARLTERLQRSRATNQRLRARLAALERRNSSRTWRRLRHVLRKRG